MRILMIQPSKQSDDLGRVEYQGGVRTEIDLGFDASMSPTKGQIAQPGLSADIDFSGVHRQATAVSARGATNDLVVSACRPPNHPPVDEKTIAVAETH